MTESFVKNSERDFRYACAKGDLELVKLHLLHGTRVNAVDSNGMSGFDIACDRQRLDVVAELMKHDEVSIDHTKHDGNTQFTYACSAGNVELVAMLLKDPRVNVRRRAKNGMTAFNNAAANGRLDVVRLLDTDPRIITDYPNHDGRTPIYYACMRGYAGIVSHLLERTGDRINHEGDGYTPLQVACAFNHPEVVKLLLEFPHTDVNLTADSEQNTPLHLVCRHRHPDLVQLFLRTPGIDINRRNAEGETPFHVAVKAYVLETVVLLLQDPRLDVNATTKEGKTVLMIAAENGANMLIEIMFASDHEVKFTLDELTWLHLRGELDDLIVEYWTDPEKTRRRLRRKHKIQHEASARLNVLVVLLCDGYLKINPSSPLPEACSRFFAIASKLPLELQMVLCNRAHDNTRDIVPSHDFNIAYDKVVWRWVQEDAAAASMTRHVFIQKSVTFYSIATQTDE